MNYLLDTHIFLWWVLNHPNLSPSMRSTIADPNHDVYVSAASAWEMTIKSSIGKLTLPSPPERLSAASDFHRTCAGSCFAAVTA